MIMARLAVASLTIWVASSLCQPALCQPASRALIANLAEAKWSREAGSESVVLRDGGGLELLVRYPPGHVFAPHWHESNERIILVEGRLALCYGDGEKFLDAGGFAFLPAREVQRLSCVSRQISCTFYVSWDGNPKSHPASELR